MSTTTVVIDPPPCDFINSNDRLHHHAKAKLTKAWRLAAYEASLIPKRNVVDRAHVVVFIRFPTNHRRDVGNFYPTAKAILDGIVSRGRFLGDDSDAHITGPDMRREYPNGPPRVTVTIEEQPA